MLSKGFEIEIEMSIHAVDKNMYLENVIVAILAGISILFFVTVMVNYIDTGLVPDFPTLMVCGGYNDCSNTKLICRNAVANYSAEKQAGF